MVLGAAGESKQDGSQTLPRVNRCCRKRLQRVVHGLGEVWWTLPIVRPLPIAAFGIPGEASTYAGKMVVFLYLVDWLVLGASLGLCSGLRCWRGGPLFSPTRRMPLVEGMNPQYPAVARVDFGRIPIVSMPRPGVHVRRGRRAGRTGGGPLARQRKRSLLRLVGSGRQSALETVNT